MLAGGPLVGFISLMLFPFIWGVPIAFITAELSTAFPEDGMYRNKHPFAYSCCCIA